MSTDKVPKLHILIGLPGSGKSTWASEDNAIILSSDAYREKLLSNINDQSNNKLIFDTLQKDTITFLKEGKDVIYDATNINRKNRKKVLNAVKDINCIKIAELFMVPVEICKYRNNQRDRKVPEEVIERMLRNFELPLEGEGFDLINLHYTPSEQKLPYTSILRKMMGFDQKNPHHTLDLYSHCAKCYNKLSNLYQEGKLGENHELVVAGLIHDFGKLYTQTYNEEKGICQYIGHENVGAYMAFYLNYKPLIVNQFKVAFYINYHMEPYRLKDAKESTLEKYKKMFGDEWDNIMYLHDADSEAH